MLVKSLKIRVMFKTNMFPLYIYIYIHTHTHTRAYIHTYIHTPYETELKCLHKQIILWYILY